MFGSIDHTAIAVADLDASIAFYAEVMGMTLTRREELLSQGVEVALFNVGDSSIELLAPLGPETAVGRFLQKRGPGLHHVAYRVDDIDTELAVLAAKGVRLIDERPRIGIEGSRIAFIHPSSMGGVLTELVQPQPRVPVPDRAFRSRR